MNPLSRVMLLSVTLGASACGVATEPEAAQPPPMCAGTGPTRTGDDANNLRAYNFPPFEPAFAKLRVDELMPASGPAIFRGVSGNDLTLEVAGVATHVSISTGSKGLDGLKDGDALVATFEAETTPTGVVGEGTAFRRFMLADPGGKLRVAIIADSLNFNRSPQKDFAAGVCSVQASPSCRTAEDQCLRVFEGYGLDCTVEGVTGVVAMGSVRRFGGFTVTHKAAIRRVGSPNGLSCADLSPAPFVFEVTRAP